MTAQGPPENLPLIAASAGDPVREEIRAIYQELDREVAQFNPKCEISGRCCRFAEYGHTLFLSEPEFTVLLSEAPAPSRPFDNGETCPWQDLKGRCTARDARPSGCRVFFCDPEYEPHASEITERFLSRLKRLAERYGLDWNYAPLHRHIHRARDDGKLTSPSESAASPQNLGLDA